MSLGSELESVPSIRDLCVSIRSSFLSLAHKTRGKVTREEENWYRTVLYRTVLYRTVQYGFAKDPPPKPLHDPLSGATDILYFCLLSRILFSLQASSWASSCHPSLPSHPTLKFSTLPMAASIFSLVLSCSARPPTDSQLCTILVCSSLASQPRNCKSRPLQLLPECMNQMSPHAANSRPICHSLLVDCPTPLFTFSLFAPG